MLHNEKAIRDLMAEISTIEPKYQYNMNGPETWVIVKKDIENMLHKYTDCGSEILVEVSGEGQTLKTVLKPLTDKAKKFLEELSQT